MHNNDYTFESLRCDEVPTYLVNQEKVYLVYESALLLLFTIIMYGMQKNDNNNR